MPRPLNRLSFAETIENYPEGIALVGDRREIRDCNDTFRRLTGIAEGPLNRFDSLVHPEYFRTWSAGLARFLSDQSELQGMVLRITSVNRIHRWIRISCHPVSRKKSESFLILINDITQQKQLEMKLIRARDNAERAARSKSEFLANTSHEIRTPIHTIISTAELLAETGLDQEQSEYLNGIQFAADVLLTLINDILDISKIEAGHLRLERCEFNLIDMLEDSIDMVTLEAHKKNVDIGLYLDPGVPACVYGDPTRLRQVVVNLINNAVKFTHLGQVVLDVETVSADPGAAVLKFTVSDSGIGIPADKHSNLFEAFHQADSATTRRFGGTGLGLFICRGIVAQMGGTLAFTSEPGHGSSFFFELRFECAENRSPVPSIPEDFFNGRDILIVDDNDEIRRRLVLTLESWGLNVHDAADAEEALSLIRAPEVCPFELILVDQTMPRIDGWQFASEVHADKDITPPPMILMSMKGGQGTVEAKMKLLGWFRSYLRKPLRRNELEFSLYRLLGGDPELEDPGELEEVEVLEPKVHSPVPEVPGGRLILIAEDHEVNRKLLQTILEKNGHRVLEAENGQEACETALRETPDIIFMDCQMPVMNGYEASRIIRRRGYEGPIISVTASALAGERERSRGFGMNDLVTKPFKQADILRMIARYLGTGREEACTDTPADDSTRYPGLPIFDFASAVRTFLGSEETVRSLLEPQMEKIAGEISTIGLCLENRDWQGLRAAAHSIKGSCRNVDMMRCGQAAAEVEDAAEAEDADRAASGLESLKREYPALKAAVAAVLTD